jgi:hypothetical protein
MRLGRGTRTREARQNQNRRVAVSVHFQLLKPDGTLKGGCGILPQRKRLEAASSYCVFQNHLDTTCDSSILAVHSASHNFGAHRPHFQILAKPCNLSQVKATCRQWLRTVEVSPQVEPSQP